MTNNPGERDPSFRDLPYPFNPDELKLESLKYLILESWIVHNIVEVPSARLPLKTAYLFYSHYCLVEDLPSVPIQAFNRGLTSVLSSRWPAARRRRTARGTLYENLTLKGWVPDDSAPPVEGISPELVVLCAA